MPREEQYTGCLIGLAVGDALGFPVEGMSLEQIRRQYGAAGIQDFVTGPRYFPPGSYSDDTQMTLAVVRALLLAGREADDALMESLRQEYIAWYKSPEVDRGPGMSNVTACANLARGMPWWESGVKASKGCGAAMRVAPIGLYYFREPERLQHVAALSAVPTHAHPTGVAAAVANAYAVARAVEKVPPEPLLEELLPLAVARSEELAAALSRVKECTGLEPPAAFAQFGETGSGEEVFASALFCFLRTPEDFRATVLAGANSSGDSDSIAAMAGALSGAYNGLEAIPERWRRQVENAAEIERLARELFTAATA